MPESEITTFIREFIKGERTDGRIGNYYVLHFDTCSVLCYKSGIGKHAVLGLHVGEGITFTYDYRPQITGRELDFPSGKDCTYFYDEFSGLVKGDITRSGVVDAQGDIKLIKLGEAKFLAGYPVNFSREPDGSISTPDYTRRLYAAALYPIPYACKDVSESLKYLVPKEAETERISNVMGTWVIPMPRDFKPPEIDKDLLAKYNSPPTIVNYPALIVREIAGNGNSAVAVVGSGYNISSLDSMGNTPRLKLGSKAGDEFHKQLKEWKEASKEWIDVQNKLLKTFQTTGFMPEWIDIKAEARAINAPEGLFVNGRLILSHNRTNPLSWTDADKSNLMATHGWAKLVPKSPVVVRIAQ